MENILGSNLAAVKRSAMRLPTKDKATLVKALSVSLEKELDSSPSLCRFGRMPVNKAKRQEQYQRCAERAAILVSIMAEVSGYNEEIIRYGARPWAYHRYIIALQLSREGHIQEAIADYLNLDRSTISSGTSKVSYIIDHPVADRMVADLYKKFINAIEQ